MSMGKNVVEKLYESDNFLVVNKPYDMYINSDNQNEKVNFIFLVITPSFFINLEVMSLLALLLLFYLARSHTRLTVVVMSHSHTVIFLTVCTVEIPFKL